MKLTPKDNVAPPAIGIMFRENDLYSGLKDVISGAVTDLGLGTSFAAFCPREVSAERESVTHWVAKNIPEIVEHQKSGGIVITDDTLSRSDQLKQETHIVSLDAICEKATLESLGLTAAIDDGTAFNEAVWQKIDEVMSKLFAETIKKYEKKYNGLPQVVLIAGGLSDHTLSAPDQKRGGSYGFSEKSNYDLWIGKQIMRWLHEAGVYDRTSIMSNATQVYTGELAVLSDLNPSISYGKDRSPSAGPILVIRDSHPVGDVEHDFPGSQQLILPITTLVQSLNEYGYLENNTPGFIEAFRKELQRRLLEFCEK